MADFKWDIFPTSVAIKMHNEALRLSWNKLEVPLVEQDGTSNEAGLDSREHFTVRVTWSAMKCAFADIRNPYTELMAATAHIPIQTPKKPTLSAVSAKHSKNVKLLTVSHEKISAVQRSDAVRANSNAQEQGKPGRAPDAGASG